MSAEILKTFNIALDVKRPVSNRDFEVVDGDTGNKLCVALSDGGTPVSLADCRVVAVFSNSAGTASQDNQREDGGITVTGESSNVAEIRLFPASVAPGSVECELQVYSGDGQDVLVTSAKFNFRCRRSMLNPRTIEATNEHPLLVALISEVNNAVTRTLHDADDIISGALAVERGGTGAGSVAAMKAAFGIRPRIYSADEPRELPFTWSQLKAKAQSGDLDGVRVGDYKTVTLAGGSFYDAADASTKTLSEQTLKMVVAGINTYHRYGDVAVGGHIDMISLHCLAPKLKYNGSATNSGGYVGSNLFTTLNGDNGIRTLLPADMAAALAQKRALTEVKTASNASSWAWNDLGLLWLPSEQEIWGQTVWSESGYGAGLAVRYPLFDGSAAQIAKNDASDARCTWWTMNTKAGSATQFVCVRYMAYPTYYSASDPDVRVPLCVRVA